MGAEMKRVIAMAGVGVALLGCEPKETDTALCRQVYTALCRRANACDELEELQACLTYYDEDCRFRRLHRGTAKPSAEEVDACLAAVSTMSCEELDPTRLPECPFLVQPPSDAGVDGGDAASDASPDGDLDAVGDGDGDSG